MHFRLQKHRTVECNKSITGKHSYLNVDRFHKQCRHCDKVVWKSFPEQLRQYICQTGVQQEGLFTDSFKGGVCIKECKICGRKIIQDTIN